MVRGDIDPYTGAADLGKIYILIIAVIGTIGSITMLIYGIRIINKSSTLITEKVKADKNSKCPVINGNTSCVTTVTPLGSDQVDVYTGFDIFQKNDDLDVWYYKTDSSNLFYVKPTKKVGWFMIGISVFIIVFGWLWVYITKSSKFAAAATGAYGIITLAAG